MLLGYSVYIYALLEARLMAYHCPFTVVHVFGPTLHVYFRQHKQLPVRFKVQCLCVAHIPLSLLALSQSIPQIVEAVSMQVFEVIVLPTGVSQRLCKVEATTGVQPNNAAVGRSSLIPASAWRCPDGILKPRLCMFIEVSHGLLCDHHRLDPLGLELFYAVIYVDARHLDSLHKGAV